MGQGKGAGGAGAAAGGGKFKPFSIFALCINIKAKN